MTSSPPSWPPALARPSRPNPQLAKNRSKAQSKRFLKRLSSPAKLQKISAWKRFLGPEPVRKPLPPRVQPKKLSIKLIRAVVGRCPWSSANREADLSLWGATSFRFQQDREGFWTLRGGENR